MLGFDLALVLAINQIAAPTGPPPPAPIYGGTRVEPGEWPSAAAILHGSSLCSGTLVSERVVLTAAHCLLFVASPQELAVYFGDGSIYAPGAPRALYDVVSYGRHPEYCSYSAECREDLYDFGYLVLDRDVEGVEPTRLLAHQDEWDQTMYLGAPITLVGFGFDEFAEEGVKRQVDVEIVGFSASRREFRAGGDGRDSCGGDSGGPAFVRLENGEYILAGVTSRGFLDCGRGGFYGATYETLCWLSDATGVDFRPEACQTCDCLDPSPEAERCGCASGDATGAVLGLILVIGARRRRRPLAGRQAVSLRGAVPLAVGDPRRID